MRCIPFMHNDGMRILYIDIDSLRPDHLGCYGYHRRTSPNIDRIASQGVRFDHCHTSDTPCMPSRTALFSGRFGLHTGVLSNAGAAAETFREGPRRGFTDTFGRTSWMAALACRGIRTATVSSFGERHSAWHWYAGFREVYNTGGAGMESAEAVAPAALDWLARNAGADDWFLHVNFWDPHTPYRAPAEVGNPFADEPLPAWLTEEVRRSHWMGCGPQSAQERGGLDGVDYYGGRWARQPGCIDSMAAVRQMFDGYDCGVLWADAQVGKLLDALDAQGVLDDTAIIISADHGECLGELNIYGCHQTADEITTRVPMIVRWPGVAPRVDEAFYYQFDVSATTIELAGGQAPPNWDGRSFAPAFRAGRSDGRPWLVLGHAMASCQRAVRWGNHVCIRTYHDGYHGLPEVLLFDVAADPHEQHDLAASRPELVDQAMSMLQQWHADAMKAATTRQDPMWHILDEGGPGHVRGQLARYLARLRATGRDHWADALQRAHGGEA
jgi:arylsulfatase A-like enzyme